MCLRLRTIGECRSALVHAQYPMLNGPHMMRSGRCAGVIHLPPSSSEQMDYPVAVEVESMKRSTFRLGARAAKAWWPTSRLPRPPVRLTKIGCVERESQFILALRRKPRAGLVQRIDSTEETTTLNSIAQWAPGAFPGESMSARVVGEVSDGPTTQECLTEPTWKSLNLSSANIRQPHSTQMVVGVYSSC